MSTIPTKAGRPARTYRTGPITRILRALSLLAAAGITAWILMAYPALPDTVATHFGAGGEADDWGPKWSILVIAGVMLALTVPLGLISTRPRLFNYPSEITEHNAQAVYRDGERMLVWTLLFLQVLYLGIAWSVILDGGAGGGPLLGLGLAGLIGASVLGIVRLVRAAR